MYTATIKSVKSAVNGSPFIYCESKSGNIYKLKQHVPVEQHANLIAKMKAAKVINTQHWMKIKEGEFVPRKQRQFKALPDSALKQQVESQRETIALLRKQIAQLKKDNEGLYYGVCEAKSELRKAEARPSANHSAAAKKGWETRRANQADITPDLVEIFAEQVAP